MTGSDEWETREMQPSMPASEKIQQAIAACRALHHEPGRIVLSRSLLLQLLDEVGEGMPEEDLRMWRERWSGPLGAVYGIRAFVRPSEWGKPEVETRGCPFWHRAGKE